MSLPFMNLRTLRRVLLDCLIWSSAVITSDWKEGELVLDGLSVLPSFDCQNECVLFLLLGDSTSFFSIPPLSLRLPPGVLPTRVVNPTDGLCVETWLAPSLSLRFDPVPRLLDRMPINLGKILTTRGLMVGIDPAMIPRLASRALKTTTRQTFPAVLC